MSTALETIGGIVTADYRTARVFDRHGIDYCCGGGIDLAEACRAQGVGLSEIMVELEAARREPVSRNEDYRSWELPFLIDYITTIHHGYLKENMDRIVALTNKIASVHGTNHPEVIEIARIFEKISADMILHLGSEEEVLFPAIKRVAAGTAAGQLAEAPDRAIIRDSLESLGQEHEAIGAATHEIKRLAHDFLIPEDVCNTFVVTYGLLQEFETDLHKHVHLENNILFPQAMHQILK